MSHKMRIILLITVLLISVLAYFALKSYTPKIKDT